MDEIEHLLKIREEKKLARERELKALDTEPADHREMMRTLQNLRKERDMYMEKLTKHLNTITAHKHSIHKIISSSNDVVGLPIPHDCAQDIKTMFTSAIDFVNDIEDIARKALNNVKENNVDSLELIQAITLCTEAASGELYQTKCRIAQLETLKENVAALQQYMLNCSSITSDKSNTTINDESTNSASTME